MIEVDEDVGLTRARGRLMSIRTPFPGYVTVVLSYTTYKVIDTEYHIELGEHI